MQNFKYSLDEWERMARSGGYEHEMNLEYYKHRVSRLQALEWQITVLMDKQTGYDINLLDELMKDLYGDTYYRSIYTTQMANNSFSATFAHIDEAKLNAIVRSGWKGANFSQRLWGNAVDDLPKTLTETLFRGITLGYGADKLARMARVKLKDFSKYQVHRLVTTETAHITEAANLASYKESGIKKVEWLATLESRTCDVCRQLDGKVFELNKAEKAPQHPFCRCTLVPVTSYDSRIDDLFASIDNKRWSRDPKTGKGKIVDDMTFDEWLEATKVKR